MRNMLFGLISTEFRYSKKKKKKFYLKDFTLKDLYVSKINVVISITGDFAVS